MAHRLQLDRPYRGMNFIWNVSQQVGDHINCQNTSTDVELVAILSAELIRAVRPAWVHPSVQQGFHTDGRMDVNLAYWIRIFNTDIHRNMQSWQEGIVSPARGTSWGGGERQIWTIVKLNANLFERNRNLWQNIPTHPNASPALRNELQ
ncbi:MAG: hypothetical protein R2681_03460 [Pyrinomonadaceae bacterium]